MPDGFLHEAIWKIMHTSVWKMEGTLKNAWKMIEGTDLGHLL